MKRSLKISVWILLILAILSALLFIRLRPSTILYAPYNGMSEYYRMYYVDQDRISVDTLPDRDLNPTKRHVHLSKACNTTPLKMSLPLVMLLDTRKTIGSPDVIDQGGMILEYKMFGITKRFNIDPMAELEYYPSFDEDLDRVFERIGNEFNK